MQHYDHLAYSRDKQNPRRRRPSQTKDEVNGLTQTARR